MRKLAVVAAVVAMGCASRSEAPKPADPGAFELVGSRIIGCCCPACGDLSLQRQRVKRLITDLEIEHAGVKQSMLKALGNVMPRHLLDTRLNPSGELRDSVALRASLSLRPGS